MATSDSDFNTLNDDEFEPIPSQKRSFDSLEDLDHQIPSDLQPHEATSPYVESPSQEYLEDNSQEMQLENSQEYETFDSRDPDESILSESHHGTGENFDDSENYGQERGEGHENELYGRQTENGYDRQLDDENQLDQTGERNEFEPIGDNGDNENYVQDTHQNFDFLDSINPFVLGDKKFDLSTNDLKFEQQVINFYLIQVEKYLKSHNSAENLANQLAKKLNKFLQPGIFSTEEKILDKIQELVEGKISIFEKILGEILVKNQELEGVNLKLTELTEFLQQLTVKIDETFEKMANTIADESTNELRGLGDFKTFTSSCNLFLHSVSSKLMTHCVHACFL